MPTPATVELSESNGLRSAEAVHNGVLNLNMGSVDTYNLDQVLHPIAQGQLSWLKWMRVHVASMGTSTSISAIKFWMSGGTPLTGEWNVCNVSINYAVSQQNIVTYGTACHAVGSTNVTTPVKGAAAFGEDAVFTTNPVSNGNLIIFPTSVPSGENVTIGVYPGTGNHIVASGPTGGDVVGPNYSDYIVFQVVTTLSTPLGALNEKTFIYQWTEV